MKKQNIQVELWDPLILDEDHNFLNSIGVKHIRINQTILKWRMFVFIMTKYCNS